MTRTEMLRLVDRMGRLWPQSGLADASKADPETLRVWYELLEPLEADQVRQAVDDLARDGERFAPTPGMVYQRAQEIVQRSRVELPPPDACRDLTPDEEAAIPRRREVLRAAVEQLMAKGWPTTRSPGSAT